MTWGGLVGPRNPAGTDPDVFIVLDVFVFEEDSGFFIGVVEDCTGIAAGVFNKRHAENISERIIAIAPMTATSGMKNFIGS